MELAGERQLKRANREPALDYERIFKSAIERLHDEGRYRVFIDILRTKGSFPNAHCFGGNGPKPITVWCSNDYLCMGQHPDVVEAMEDGACTKSAPARAARATSAATPITTPSSKPSSQASTARKARCCSPAGYVSNEAALSTLGKLLPGCIIFSDELNHASMIAGIKSSRLREARLPP